MESKPKFLLFAVAVTLSTAGAVSYAAISAGGPEAAVFGGAPTPTVINCANGYSTDLGWNVSHEEVLSTVPDATVANFNAETAAGMSDIVSSVTVANGQFYNYESGKNGYGSWKFGTGSKAGSITFSLTKGIDAIGFYAVAYANSKDVGKYLAVNGVKVDQPLKAATPFDQDDLGQRFFVELDEAASEVTISANAASNNRFYLYSVGFYSSQGFPEAA